MVSDGGSSASSLLEVAVRAAVQAGAPRRTVAATAAAVASAVMMAQRGDARTGDDASVKMTASKRRRTKRKKKAAREAAAAFPPPHDHGPAAVDDERAEGHAVTPEAAPSHCGNQPAQEPLLDNHGAGLAPLDEFPLIHHSAVKIMRDTGRTHRDRIEAFYMIMFPDKLTHILELLDTQYLGQEQILHLRVCNYYDLQPAPESTAAAATATTEEAADAHRQVPVDTIMDGTQSEDTFSRSSQNSTAARAQSQHPMRPRPTIARTRKGRHK